MAIEQINQLKQGSVISESSHYIYSNGVKYTVE